jgi:hypothetical protein
MDAPTLQATRSHTGMRRVIPPWEFRHLHAWAGMRIGGGAVLTVCGVLTLTFGGQDGKTLAWAATFLAVAALAFAAGFWELSVARRMSRRTASR